MRGAASLNVLDSDNARVAACCARSNRSVR